MNSYFVRLRIRIIVLILLFIYFLSFVCKFIPQFLEMLASYLEEPVMYMYTDNTLFKHNLSIISLTCNISYTQNKVNGIEMKAKCLVNSFP